jgi:hypothetical protein
MARKSNATARYAKVNANLQNVAAALEKFIASTKYALDTNAPKGWDPAYGTLRASISGWDLIDSRPAEFQRINLKIQVSQARQDYRGFVLDYEVLSSPQMHSNSWPDVSMSEAAQNYIDALKAKLSHCIENALDGNSKPLVNLTVPRAL